MENKFTLLICLVLEHIFAFSLVHMNQITENRIIDKYENNTAN